MNLKILLPLVKEFLSEDICFAEVLAKLPPHLNV
jgi:hypothetical protein